MSNFQSWLNSLLPKERNELGEKAREILLQRKCKESYYDFFKEFWNEIESEPLSDNWHVEYLCNELQKVAQRLFLKSDGTREELEYNLIINISPGETKSSICTIFFPVWLWVNDPTIRIITLSYSASLSLAHATRSRDIIRSPKFQAWFGDKFQLRKDMEAKSEYGVFFGPGFQTPGGVRFTGSVGGSLTGRHAHLILSDDPVNAQQANSDAERKTANEFMTTTLASRKVDQKITPTVLVMQRLHENDPTAEMAKKWADSGKLKWIRLPATDEYIIHPSDLERFYVQDGTYKVMNPLRKPARVMEENRKTYTASDFSGQFGQDPQPAEGNKLKKAWFEQRFTLAELEDRAKWKRQNIQWNAVIDGAYTKNTNNSATGILVFTVFEQKLYLRAFAQLWLEFPELCQQLPAFVKRHGVGESGTVFVEPKATGKSLVQTLRMLGGINIVEDSLPEGVSSQQGKELRVDNATPFFSGMNCFLLDGVDWKPFIDQAAVFPNGKHTDLVDCLCMAKEKVVFVSGLGAWERYLSGLGEK